MIPFDIHSFSRPFARRHGATAAVLLKHLAYKVRKSKKIINDKKWHYNAAKKLQKKLPYLSSSTISEQIKKLERKKLLEIGNFNKWAHDRTQWYHVTSDICYEVEKDRLSFDAEVATDVGILPAVLHFNLHHFIRLQLNKKVKNPTHVMSPKALAKLLHFSESAIKKGLKALVEKGLIVKLKSPRSTYTLPDSDLVLMRQIR